MMGDRKWLFGSGVLFITFHRASSSALECSYCVKVGGFYLLHSSTPSRFFFVSPRHPIQGCQSYSHLPPTNLLACRCLLLLLFLTFIASAQGRMRKHRSSHGNLLSLLVFQQRVWSVINLSFHLHVQQEEEWDWPFINIIRKGMNPALPLWRVHFLTWHHQNEPSVDQLDLGGDEAPQDIKPSRRKGEKVGLVNVVYSVSGCLSLNSRAVWGGVMTDGHVSSKMKLFQIGLVDSHVVQSPAVLQNKMQRLLWTDMWPHLCMWGAISKGKSMIL